jgi:hypothetical protein
MIRLIKAFLLITPILVLMMGCSNDKPKAIWNPNIDLAGSPVITGLVPDGKVFFEETEIRILGENFSPTLEENIVYFNNEKAVLLSASATELKVNRPRVTGDSITVKVVVGKQIGVAVFSPYKIDKVSDELGNFTRSNTLYSIAVDRDENVYAYSQGPIIYKITPDNVKTEFALPPMTRSYQIRIGPGGYLYMAGTVDKIKGVFRIPPTGGGDMEMLYNSAKRVFQVVEFDQNGRLFTAGKISGMFIIHDDGTATDTGRFLQFNISDMRIYNGYVYVLSTYSGPRKDLAEMGLFKAQLLDDGTVGEETVAYDWSKAGDYAGAKLLSFAIAEDGDFYLGCSAPDPVLILHQDGSLTPLYSSLLVPSAMTLVWGNDTFLYMVRGNEGTGTTFDAGRLFRIRLTKSGAPYYGR